MCTGASRSRTMTPSSLQMWSWSTPKRQSSCANFGEVSVDSQSSKSSRSYRSMLKGSIGLVIPNKFCDVCWQMQHIEPVYHATDTCNAIINWSNNKCDLSNLIIIITRRTCISNTVLFRSIRPGVWPVVTKWTKFWHRQVGGWPVTNQKFRVANT